ncbi:hypothetical protein SKAU_G00045480 [Synaphobranchus kaupii]|uniref:Uncharacterized protein n=1 Tax=Synaphobranchus kaupii TaxID=118154 RepID=A0A9Q1J8W8_SYNKA|nr:hypothetical protein SKAU_G00045480 [Synaphobranchus kaupii]
MPAMQKMCTLRAVMDKSGLQSNNACSSKPLTWGPLLKIDNQHAGGAHVQFLRMATVGQCCSGTELEERSWSMLRTNLSQDWIQAQMAPSDGSAEDWEPDALQSIPKKLLCTPSCEDV